MKYIIPIILMILLIAVALRHTRYDRVNSSDAFPSGIYEFVSEKTTYTSPSRKPFTRVHPEWSGRWFFVNGHFSFDLMKVDRKDWITGFPANTTDLEFQSASGIYRVSGDRIGLKYEVALAPHQIGFVQSFRWVLSGDTLILTERLLPNTESPTDAETITTLRRIN